jgi:hypothetical protein
MNNLAKLTGIKNGNWEPLCKVAISPYFVDSKYNAAPDGGNPAVTTTTAEEKAFSLPIGNLGTSNLTITTKFTTGSDITTTQWVAGFVNTYPRFEIIITGGAGRNTFGLSSALGSRTLNPPVEANKTYLMSIIINRKLHTFSQMINGDNFFTLTDATKIPSTGDFNPAVDFISGKSGVAEFLGLGPYFTYLHLAAFSEEQIKAIHKQLGA